MQDPNGVRLGQPVRDLDGTSLGRVTRLYDEAFATRKGLPVLFRRDYVVRYDEVRGVRDGELVVARSRRDLFELNAGEVPSSWRIPVPPDFPSAATPPEAASLRADLARGAVPGSVARAPEPPAAPVPPAGVDDELPESARRRDSPLPRDAGEEGRVRASSNHP